MRKIYFLFVIFISTLIHAKEIDVSQPLRILDLMPKEKLFVSLGIDPHIPGEFVALSRGGGIDYSGIVYWGKKESIESFLKDPMGVFDPIIAVRFAYQVNQNGESFQNEEYIRKNVADDLDTYSLRFGNWGDYPYYIISGMKEDESLDILFLGMNEENGNVLVFYLIEPQIAKKDKKYSGQKLWRNFIEKTAQLPEPLQIKARGQELHDGHTIVNVLGRKVDIFVEKRKKDKKYRVIMKTENPSVKYKCEDVFICFKGDYWRSGDPTLKITGILNIDNDWVKYRSTSTVFVRETEEFTKAPSENVIYNKTFSELELQKIPLSEKIFY